MGGGETPGSIPEGIRKSEPWERKSLTSVDNWSSVLQAPLRNHVKHDLEFSSEEKAGGPIQLVGDCS